MPLDIFDPTREYALHHPSGAVFTLRHWTVADQELVERECIVQDGSDPSGSPLFKWNQTRDREIKIGLCVVGWSGVTMEGAPFECTAENKKKLPVGVQVWIFKEIEERAGLRMSAQEKKT